MKKIGIIIGLIVLVVLGFNLVTTNDHHDDHSHEFKNKVGTTIFPIYDIATQVAGDRFEVVLMLPPGTSPHTFDAQPSLLKELSGSQTVFAIGQGLDNWSLTLAESVGAKVVTVDTGVKLRETVDGHQDGHMDHGDKHKEVHDEHGHKKHDHEEESHNDHDDHHDEEEHDDHGDKDEADSDHEEDHHDHNHGPIDPHYWLSIHNAEKIAENVANELSKLDPANATIYSTNAESYIAELEILEEELDAKVTNLSNPNIIALHDAWYYFAEEFGLNLVGTFEPSAGKNPTPQYLEKLQREVEENGVTTLFLEPQLSSDGITAFANDNDLGIAVIDPLGGVEGRESYIDLMRFNVDAVVNAG